MNNNTFDHLRGLEYNSARKWIRDNYNHCPRLKRGATWEELFLATKDSKDKLDRFLHNKSEDDGWPSITIEEWEVLVADQKAAEEETIRIEGQNGAATIHGSFQNNNVGILPNDNSCWHKFRDYYINEKQFSEDTMNTIERAAFKTLKRLSSNTIETGPIKGLIIGNVQSGKTANMAALMAMAADWGWNMFIVLSGTIESLRLQTLARLNEDLNRPGCMRTWRPLNYKPKPNLRDMTLRTTSMHWGQYDNDRYFTVCLKQKNNLRNLIGWLREDLHIYRQMKILIIDDEADQAGVNAATQDQERKIINSLIMSLVNGSEIPHDGDGKEVRDRRLKNIVAQCQAMNYIAYTATPYSNLLNESDYYTIYPKDFISTLAVSKEYMGPQQIFGCEDSDYDGLDIIRKIDSQDLNDVKEIHNGSTQELPQSFKNALLWFMCGVACMRLGGRHAPISMLVHTSSNTNHHLSVANSIDKWISESNIDELIISCRKIWEAETQRFSIESFLDSYPDYTSIDQIKDYPSFNEIESGIRTLLGGRNRISKIQVEANDTPTYHDGLHLCVDNSRNNGINDEGEITRLIYPTKERMPKLAPAFIVVGGATLSRGLTLEGLICTYFGRSVNFADSLMQMGRWFGYRKGYELIPRIWLTEKTKEQFGFLSQMDDDLRREIYTMEVTGVSPSDAGPRILESPNRALIQLCAKNKSKEKIKADMNYMGAMLQTYLFDNDNDILESNLKTTKRFLESLYQPQSHKKCNKNAANALVWKQVPFDKIADYLTTFHFQSRLNVLNDLTPLIAWITQMTAVGNLESWSVILAGLDRSKDYAEDELWKFGNGLSIPKIHRTRKVVSDNSIININTLRNVTDILADIDLENLSDQERDDVLKASSNTAQGIRTKLGYGKIPELIIYIINKNSKLKKPSQSKQDLATQVDVAGIFINIPGRSKNAQNSYVYKVTIKLNKNLQGDDELIDD